MDTSGNPTSIDFASFGNSASEDGAANTQAAARAALQGFLDEEDLLGFHVWVAELELLVGTARASRADPVACFELLQKLLVSIDRTDRSRLKEYGRRCEAALIDILLKGTAPPARRLICASLSRLYAAGDALPMYARVAALQGFLGSKEALGRGAGVPEAARVGALQCLADLCAAHGRALASGMLESLNVAVKHTARTSEPSTRCAALALMVASIEGLGSFDRNAEAVQTLALKTVMRVIKDTPDAATLTAVTGVLQAIACTEGIALWANTGAGYEELVRLCTGGLNHPSLAVSHGFAAVLGAMAAAATTSRALASAQAAEKKASRKAVLDRIASEAFATCLVEPFVEAAAAGDRPRACAAVAQSWLTYMRLLQAQEHAEESQLLDLAVKAVEMLSRCSRASSGSGSAEAELGAGLASGEVPQPQACVLYVLRVGVIEQLGELSQRRLLEKLAELASARGKVCVALVALECMRIVTGVLGEVPVEGLPRLKEPVTAQLVSPHACLRSQAASTLAALAVAEQASAALMLESCLDNLATAAVQLTALLSSSGGAGPQHRQQATSAAAASMHAALSPAEAERVRPLMDALHGNATGAAALLVASTRMPLGVPSRLVQQGVELAQSLITRPSCKRAVGQGREREAGYILLGALCICLPAASLQDRKLEMLELWRVALSADAAKQLDLRQYVTSSMAEGEAVLAMELAWRTAALEALQAYMASILPHASRSQSTRVQRMLSSLLQPTLDAVCTSPALQDPVRGGRAAATLQFGAATAMLQLRLLEAYLSMPNAATFQTQHEALIRLCARSLRPGTIAPVVVVAGAASGLAASSTLQGLLNKQDAALGPWSAARNPLEDALQAFAGAPGGPLQQAWQTGLHPSGDGDDGMHQTPSSITGSAASPPFPQTRALGTALLEAHVTLLGSLLAVVSQQNQLQILDLLATAAAAPSGKARDKDAPGTRRGVVTAVCCAALAGLVVLARPQRGEVESREGVADKVRALAEVVLVESTATAGDGPDAALQRCSAEMFAFAACIGSDGYASQLARALCQAAADTTSHSRRATLALAAGCMYRSKGGMALQAAVGVTVQTLLALGRSQPPGVYHLWYLHGLWLVANSAGLAFVPFVKATLALSLDALMWEEAEVGAAVRAAVGRLANALVAVLGPELSPGSAAYSNTKSLIRGMQSTESQALASAPASGDVMAAELERVLYVQMLVLFAPQAVPAAAHLPLLVHTLQAAQPSLRQAAAATLRHLAERDPGAMPSSQMEAVLFAALDREADAGIAAQLRATLRTLLHAGAPTQPAHWLSVCSSVALASGPAGSAAAVAASGGPGVKAGGGDLDQGLMEGADSDDSDADESATAKPAAPSAPAQAEAPALAPALATAKSPATPRLRTRLFAARCVLELPAAVGPNPCHFDAIAAQQAGQAQAGAWLVLQLQQLVDAGFKMATGQVEALRPLGLHLLKTVMARFAKAEDPLMDGHSLLEQYQAQYVSALRSALAREAPAALSAAGAALAVAFMRTGMALEDGAMLRHLMRLLCRPLADWGTPQPEAHAEWVGMRAHVALLEAHAHCTVLASASAAGAVNADCSQAVHQAQAPFLWLLRNHWSALVADHMVLSTQPPAVQLAFVPRLFPTAPQPSVAAIAKFLETAWPHVLAAVSASLATQQEPLPAQLSSTSSAGLNASGRLAHAASEEQGAAAGQGLQQLAGDMLALLVDACHLAISRATATMDRHPGRQVSWKPTLPSRATMSLTGGEEDDLALSSAAGLPQLSAALACLQRLLSAAVVLDTIGIEGCGDAVRLLLHVLQQVLQPQASTEDALVLQHLTPCLQASAAALQGLLSALPTAYLEDAFLQELLVHGLLSTLSTASLLSRHPLPSTALQPPAAIAFAAAEKLMQQLTEGGVDGHVLPAWVVLPLWQAAVELLTSCPDEAMLEAACTFLTSTLSTAAAPLVKRQQRLDSDQAAELGGQVAATATSIAEAATGALAVCQDGEFRPGHQHDSSFGAEARAVKMMPLVLHAGSCLPSALFESPAELNETAIGEQNAQQRLDSAADEAHAAFPDSESAPQLDNGAASTSPLQTQASHPAEAVSPSEGAALDSPHEGLESQPEEAGPALSESSGSQPAASLDVPDPDIGAAALQQESAISSETQQQQQQQQSGGAWSNAGSDFGSDWEQAAAQEPEALQPRDSTLEPSPDDELVLTARDACLQALEDAVSAGSPAMVRLSTLQATRLACQAAAAPAASSESASDHSLRWSLSCTATVVPAASALAVAQLSSDGCSSLSAEDVQVITELFKLLLVAQTAVAKTSTVSHARQPVPEGAVMQLLVPLAVAALAPEHGSPHPEVAALVQQLVMRLAAGPTAPAFRDALSTLSPASMQSFQAALRASAASSQPAGTTASAASKLRQPLAPPSIALKNFAISKPSA